VAILERSFPTDHAAAQGHFPGNPIIPGAVLLSEVLLAIEADLGRRLHACRVKSAKFVHPVRPGDRIRLRMTVLEAKISRTRVASSCGGYL